MKRARGRKRAGGDRENGAALVEFAMLLPFLLLLILGIVEFGYFIGEFNDVRHGAREGARLAAVDAGNTAFLETETCSRMDLTSGVTVEFSGGEPGKIGDTGTVTVIAQPGSLSGLGLIEIFLPNQLSSTVDFRLEQDANWLDSSGAYLCT